MSIAAWSLQCAQCHQFIGRDINLALRERDGEEVACHYDALARQWCGPVQRVELRSETE
jgi:hypothetical protein